jgi:hypothetical protein
MPVLPTGTNEWGISVYDRIAAAFPGCKLKPAGEGKPLPLCF